MAFLFTGEGQAWGQLSKAVEAIVHPNAKPTLPMVNIAFTQKGLPQSFAEMIEYTPHMVDLAMKMGIEAPGYHGKTNPVALAHYLVHRGNEWLQNQSNNAANSSITSMNSMPPTSTRSLTPNQRQRNLEFNMLHMPNQRNNRLARRMAEIRQEMMEMISESPLLALTLSQGGAVAQSALPFLLPMMEIDPLLPLMLM